MKKNGVKVCKKDFLEDLEDNEEYMGEGAAFAVTCEQNGITEDQAYELLASEDDE